jgi:hypothetical protein
VGGEPLAEPRQEGAEVEPRQAATEHLEDGLGLGPEEDLLLAALLHGVELDPAEGRVEHRRKVTGPGDGLGLARSCRPADGGGADRLQVPDGEPHRHARALVDVGRATELLGQRGQDLHQVRRDPHRDVAGRRPGLLIHDPDLLVERLRVVGPNLGAEPILQRRHDPAPVRVVLRVGRGHQQQVEGQADPVAADLDVALLEDVEQRHLDPFGQVGELVDGHDAAVRPRDQAVVDGQLVGQVPALRHPDGVDVADQVGHGRVRRGQLLRVPVVPADPRDRRLAPSLGHQGPAPGADRPERMVVDLAALDRRNMLVQEVDQVPDQPGLGLSPLAEEDQVVPGQQAPLQPGNDRVVEADDAGEQLLAPAHPVEEVLPELLLHRPIAEPGGPEMTEGGRAVHEPTLLEGRQNAGALTMREERR